MPNSTAGNGISSSAQLGADVVTTGKIKDGEIVNADINAAAAIALSKISGAAASGANTDITSLGSLSTPLSTGQGGIGVASPTAHCVLIAEGASAVTAITPDTAGKVLKSNGVGADPSFQDNTLDWQQVGQTVLGAPGLTLSVGSIPARKHYRVEVDFNVGPAAAAYMTFNGDTGNNYAQRVQKNGAADATSTSRANLDIMTGSAGNKAILSLWFSQHAANVKAIFWEVIDANSKTTAPDVWYGAGLWDNTAAAISTITLTSGSNFATGAIMTVYASKD